MLYNFKIGTYIISIWRDNPFCNTPQKSIWFQNTLNFGKIITRFRAFEDRYGNLLSCPDSVAHLGVAHLGVPHCHNHLIMSGFRGVLTLILTLFFRGNGASALIFQVNECKDPGDVKPEVDAAFTPITDGFSYEALFDHGSAVSEMKLENMPTGLDVNSQRE